MSIDNNELLARVELLMLALRPFAEVGTCLSKIDDDDKTAAIVTDARNKLMHLTYGDFRMATDVLAELMVIRHTMVEIVVDDNIVYLPTKLKD